MSTTYSSAPNLRKWKKPCWAMMPPIRKVMSAMIGTACQATRSRWYTADVRRKVRGRISTATRACARAPSMFRNTMKSRPRSARPRPTCSRADDEPVGAGRPGRRFAIGGVHLCQQPVVAGRQVENAQVRSARLPGPHEALEQPRAVGVEFLPRRACRWSPDRRAGRRAIRPRRAAPIAWRGRPSRHRWPSVRRGRRTSALLNCGAWPKADTRWLAKQETAKPDASAVHRL